MTKKRLLRLGAGDFARELLWAISRLPADQRNWEVGGFLDDNPDGAVDRLMRYGLDLPVFGAPGEYQPQHGD